MAHKVSNAVEAPVSENESVNVSIRKIDNGYIKSTSRYGGDKGYVSTEEFCTDKPQIEVNCAPNEAMASGPSSLRKAMDSYRSQKK